jgi:hypothetical protein
MMLSNKPGIGSLRFEPPRSEGVNKNERNQMSNYWLRGNSELSEGRAIITDAEALSPGLSDFSYCLWADIRQAGSFMWGAGHQLQEINVDLHLSMLNDKMMGIMSDVVTNKIVTITGNTSISDNKPHLITLTCDRDSSTGLRLYIDGKEDADAIDPTELALSNFIFDSFQLIIRTISAIDQFRFYKGIVLTPEQVREIYYNGYGSKIDIDEIRNFIHDEYDDEASFWGAEFNEGIEMNFMGMSYAGGNLSYSTGTLNNYVTWESGGVPFSLDRHLCTLADIKTRLGLSITDNDDIIEQIIDGIDGFFDNYTHRKLLLTDSAITEYYGLDPGLRRLLLRRYPIVSIISIKEASDYDFVDAEALVANADYRLVNSGLNGIILRLDGHWLSGEDTIQVLYRGGYCGANEMAGEGEYDLPQELHDAAIMQACFIFKRKDDIGLDSVSTLGGSISKFAEIELLPLVRQVLDKYKQLSL